MANWYQCLSNNWLIVAKMYVMVVKVDGHTKPSNTSKRTVFALKVHTHTLLVMVNVKTLDALRRADLSENVRHALIAL